MCNRHLRKSKIEKLRAGLRQHDVAGLQISVNNTLAMRFVQGIGNLNSVLESLVERQSSFLQSVGECISFDVLHHHEVNAVLAGDVVKRADVWMVQAGDSTGFTLESLGASGLLAT